MELTIDNYLSARKASGAVDLTFRVASFIDLKYFLLAALVLAGSRIYLVVVNKSHFEVSKGMVEKTAVVNTPGLYGKVSKKLKGS